ncbi:MAG: hypothetical protein MUP63_01820 [Candidatus Nanohaloarchaeota archaeon QJJ-7]|nr:hypothetical protein [Candidatus Nanohaloarchaeota archaeon QJJ-7]
MEIKLSIEEEGSGEREEVSVEVEEGSSIETVLQEAGVNPETVIVERDRKIVPKGEEVEDNELKVLRVISGG